MVHVLTIQQKKEWREIISRSLKHDFYHTWYYHYLNRSGVPILFVYEHNSDFVAFPFIQRAGSQNRSDLVSVYGYVGPVSNRNFQDLDIEMLEGFKESLSLFLRQQGISSLSSRLHPFIDQGFLISKLGGDIKEGKSVAIDLSIPIEEQRKNYRRNLWGDIKKMLKKGYYLKENNTDAAVRTFMSIYWENMKRIGAEKVYYFDEQYFFDFIKSDDFDVRLVSVIAGEETICASLITLKNGLIQGYLIGTRGQYLCESPAKLLVDQVSVMGRELGMKYYNLGGGLNFEEDQLFKWKSGFSRLYLNCHKWTCRSFNGAKSLIGFFSNLYFVPWQEGCL